MIRSSRWDWAIGIAFLLGGGVLGAAIVWRAGVADIYAIFMPELVYHACGFGWVRPETMPPQLLDFVFLRVQAFDCAALTFPDKPAFGHGIFVQSQLYLATVAGWIWQLSSISFRNLWPLAAVLAGTYACGCFALLRLFFSRWLAILGATILTLSPIMLSMVIAIRDYSKAPFFIWSLVILIVAVRSPHRWAAIGWGALAGMAIGLGYGFRADTIIMLPIGVLFLALVWPRAGWLSRIGTASAFIAATLIVASPMFSTRNSGGFGSLLMQGLTEPYQNYLGLGPAPYSFGTKYSDELTLSMIAADISKDDPLWATKEGRPGEGITQAVLRSGPYVLGWLPSFAGDMATQALKSAMWILGMPALVSPERQVAIWKLPVPSAPSFAAPLVRFYGWIGDPLLPWVGLAGIIVFLWQSFAARRSETIALSIIFGAMLAYTVVQFAIRHMFHLEFFWVIGALALLRVPFHIKPMRQTARLFLPLVAILIGSVVAVRFGLVAYQDRALNEKLRTMLALPRETITPERVSASNGKTFIKVAVPPDYRQLIDGPPDSMDNTMGQRGTQWKVIASADRLLVTVDGASCPAGRMRMNVRHAKRATVWQPQDYEISVDLKVDSKMQILMPALYRATQYFDGVEVESSFAPCIAKIERMIGEKDLPIALAIVLPTTWESQPLHRAFGDFGSRRPEPSYFSIRDTAE